MAERLIAWMLTLAAALGWQEPPPEPEPFEIEECCLANYPEGEISFWSGEWTGQRYTHQWLGLKKLGDGRLYDGVRHYVWGSVDELPGRSIWFISNAVDNHGAICYITNIDADTLPDMRALQAVDMDKMSGGVGG